MHSGNIRYGGPDLSAHLVMLDPASGQLQLLGDVVSQLKRLGVYRPGENQMKIHSKIVQADDGWLYFTSTDEQGEKEDGSQYATWGSHLWRIRPGDGQWEHLLQAKESLLACATAGRYVYALGAFGHVLFQLDTRDLSVLRTGWFMTCRQANRESFSGTKRANDS